MKTSKSTRAGNGGLMFLNLITLLALGLFLVGCDGEQSKPVQHVQAADFRYMAGGQMAQEIVRGIELDGCCGDMRGDR